MKTLLIAFLTAASVLALLPARGAAQSEASAGVPNATSQFDQARLGLITRATALLGANVRDRGDSSVGRMEDIFVDLSAGQAVAGLVSFGVDNQLMLVPARSFSTPARSKVLVTADKKTLKGAPCISRTELGLGLEPDCLSRSFNYFHQELPKATATAPGRLLCAATMVQQHVLGQNRELLGQVADIVMDLPMGRAVYLLVQPAAGTEAQGVLYAVPPQAVSTDATSHALILEADQAHFLAGPHFQKEYGTELSRPEFAAAVQQHYAPRAAATSTTDATGAKPPAAGDAASAAAPAASARSDQEITEAVVSELVRDNKAFSTQDLKITTSNGRVTLASHVKNEKQKQVLVAAAARIVGLANVDAQVETQSKR